MDYNIKGTALTITPEIRTYVEKRLQSLGKFVGEGVAARADVEVGFLKDEAKQYTAEIMIHCPGQESRRAEARGASLHEAVDIAVSEMSRELGAGKKKRLHIFRRSAAKVKDILRGFRQ